MTLPAPSQPVATYETCNWIDGSSASRDWTSRMGEEKGKKWKEQGSFIFSSNGTAVVGNEHFKKGMGLPLFLPVSSSFLLLCRRSVNSRFISTAAWERASLLSAILSGGSGGKSRKHCCWRAPLTGRQSSAISPARRLPCRVFARCRYVSVSHWKANTRLNYTVGKKKKKDVQWCVWYYLSLKHIRSDSALWVHCFLQSLLPGCLTCSAAAARRGN